MKHHSTHFNSILLLKLLKMQVFLALHVIKLIGEVLPGLSLPNHSPFRGDQQDWTQQILRQYRIFEMKR